MRHSASGATPSRPLLIGSVKTNIGHLEAAAGIAGLIKVILSLEHEVLPKHLHFQNPSPHIPWDRLPVRVVDEATPWERNGRPRIAGVSSFGFSGTNAHVILEEAPMAQAQHAGGTASAPPTTGASAVLPLSARTPRPPWSQVADQYRSWLTAHPEATLADVCFTAGVGRSHFEHRAALVVNSTESAVELLGALADDRPAPGLVRGECADTPKTAWLFTGQGSQYAGMARELFDTEPVFAETMTRCAEVVADVLEKPLLDVIFDVDGPDAEDDVAADLLRPARLVRGGDGPGPALAVVGLRTRCGARPQRRPVLGGLRRGRVQSRGRRAADGRARPPLRQLARGRSDGRGLRRRRAGREPDRRVPAPVGGRLQRRQHRAVWTRADLEQAVAGLAADGVRCDWLDTSHAFHSALLDPVLDEFESYANRFEFAPPQRTLVCNRTGAALGRSVKLDGAYWRRHARQPVEFAKSVRTLADLDCTVLLEIGPQPVLTAAALRAWPDPATAPRAIASLRRNTADHRQITEALADAYIAGHRPDFAALRQADARKLDLPTYPFQHRQYWFRDKREPAQPGCPTTAVPARTETVRLLEDGRIEELAALLDGASGNQQTVNVLTKLAAQHNQQRTMPVTITDARYEIRWEKSATASSSAEAGEGSTWLLIGDDADAVQPLVDVLTARGDRHQIFGLPASDADEEQLAAALRAAAADDPTTRIVHVAPSTRTVGPSARASLLRMQHEVLSGTRRLFRAAVAAELRAPIWVVTRGAQRVTDADTVSPEQSCLWGFGRAAALELPQVWGGLADLSAGSDWGERSDGKCHRRMVPVRRHVTATPRSRPPGKTKSRCVNKRSMFPGWSDALGSRAARRWNCVMTQRIW